MELEILKYLFASSFLGGIGFLTYLIFNILFNQTNSDLKNQIKHLDFQIRLLENRITELESDSDYFKWEINRAGMNIVDIQEVLDIPIDHTTYYMQENEINA